MLEKLPLLQMDPILSILQLFQEDKHKEKMDLGIGVYKDEEGNTPILLAVQGAQKRVTAKQMTKGYLAVEGNQAFNHRIKTLLFGRTPTCFNRAAVIQTPGASGALRMIADLIYFCRPQTTVWLSAPTYINHQPVMTSAGLHIAFYPYFSSITMQVDFNAMMDTLKLAKAGDVVLLHGCCHNPTGADLSPNQWQALADLIEQKALIPFIDMAYQGLGDGFEQDGYGMRLLAQRVEQMFVAVSCSKNFGLYRERVGAAVVIANDEDQAQKGKLAIQQLARASYTMPPDHGAAIVAEILTDQQFQAQWHKELEAMRRRIITLRNQLSDQLNQIRGDDHFDFIRQHKGMFSMLGITPEQVTQLRREFGIYVVSDGRMNVAGLVEPKVEYFANALAKVTG